MRFDAQDDTSSMRGAVGASSEYPVSVGCTISSVLVTVSCRQIVRKKAVSSGELLNTCRNWLRRRWKMNCGKKTMFCARRKLLTSPGRYVAKLDTNETSIFSVQRSTSRVYSVSVLCTAQRVTAATAASYDRRGEKTTTRGKASECEW